MPARQGTIDGAAPASLGVALGRAEPRILLLHYLPLVRRTRQTATGGQSAGGGVIRRRLVVVKKRFKLKPQVPKESDEQESLFSYAAAACHRYPELKLLYANMNGLPLGRQERFAVVNWAKRRGMRNGLPDVTLPVQRIVNGVRYAGLYIELKRIKGGVLSPEQSWWLDELRKQGYKAEYCHGFKEAAELIISYLLGEKVAS